MSSQKKKSTKRNVSNKKPSQKSINDRLSLFIKKYEKFFLAITLLLFFIFSLLLFDGFIEPMADDANFLVESHRLIHDKTYPSFSSVFYTSLLSFSSWIFGFNPVGFKLLSYLSALFSILIFYLFFRKRFNRTVWLSVLLIMVSNFAIQYYSSSVMSESFFMMLQLIVIAFAFKSIDKVFETQNYTLEKVKKDWIFWTGFSLLVFLLSITKNLAVIVPVVIILHFLLYRRFLPAGVFLGLFVAWRVVYALFLKLFFGAVKTSNQWNTLLLKNYYKPDEGKEDLVSFVGRYWTNLDFHVSSDMLRILGFRDQFASQSTWPVFSLIFVGCTLYLMYIAYKKSKYHFFLGLYLLITMSVVFAALQTHWKQDRMIIAFVPLILLFIFQGLKTIMSKASSAWHYSFLVSLALIFFVQLRHMPAAIEKNGDKLSYLLSGDNTGAYTQDWKNFMAMSNWVANELPEGSKVLCRKPNTAVVYGDGRFMFDGVYRSTRESGDKILANFNERKITHIMACSLRLNPAQAVEGRVIGTVHSFTNAIARYDQKKLTTVHKIGDTEPCILYKINY